MSPCHHLSELSRAHHLDLTDDGVTSSIWVAGSNPALVRQVAQSGRAKSNRTSSVLVMSAKASRSQGVGLFACLRTLNMWASVSLRVSQTAPTPFEWRVACGATDCLVRVRVNGTLASGVIFASHHSVN